MADDEPGGHNDGRHNGDSTDRPGRWKQTSLAARPHLPAAPVGPTLLTLGLALSLAVLGPRDAAAESPLKCDDAARSGGQGVTTRVVDLGRTSGTFLFSWDTMVAPDAIVVSYEGITLLSTGKVSGKGSQTLSYKGASRQIQVTVTGTGNGTQWNFKASCPAPLSSAAPPPVAAFCSGKPDRVLREVSVGGGPESSQLADKIAAILKQVNIGSGPAPVSIRGSYKDVTFERCCEATRQVLNTGRRRSGNLSVSVTGIEAPVPYAAWQVGDYVKVGLFAGVKGKGSFGLGGESDPCGKGDCWGFIEPSIALTLFGTVKTSVKLKKEVIKVAGTVEGGGTLSGRYKFPCNQFAGSACLGPPAVRAEVTLVGYRLYAESKVFTSLKKCWSGGQ